MREAIVLYPDGTKGQEPEVWIREVNKQWQRVPQTPTTGEVQENTPQASL